MSIDEKKAKEYLDKAMAAAHGNSLLPTQTPIIVVAPKPARKQDGPVEEPLLLTPRQAARKLNLSERTIGNLMDRGELVRRKIGSKTLIPVTSIEAFVKRDHATKPRSTK